MTVRLRCHLFGGSAQDVATVATTNEFGGADTELTTTDISNPRVNNEDCSYFVSVTASGDYDFLFTRYVRVRYRLGSTL